MQMTPNRRTGWVLAAFIFLLLAGMLPNAVTEIVDVSPWLILLLLAGIILIPFAWMSFRDIFRSYAVPVRTGDRPAPHPGLILFLSLFSSRGDKQKKGMAGKDWRLSELESMLDSPDVDWPLIIERFEHSNMQPALEAVRYHAQDDTLQHVWLITTLDLKTSEGEVRQTGSHNLAPVFKRILNEGFAFNVSFHWAAPELKVPTYDVEASYEAIQYVYTEAAPEYGLKPSQVMADLTGGRVPMTGGMLLYCAPRGYAMQYTTTDRDPAKRDSGDVPVPLAIEVNTWELRRSTLEAAATEATPKRGRS